MHAGPEHWNGSQNVFSSRKHLSITLGGKFMKLSYEGLQDQEAWAGSGIKLPGFDWKAMVAETMQAPVWIHFGAGNIFRGFIARLQQSLLEQGLAQKGIVAAETFDFDIIEQIYKPFDSMALMVSLKADGSMTDEVVASIACGLRASAAFPEDLAALTAAFRSETLQMASFTITEKGYALKNASGDFFPFVTLDFANGPSKCTHAMSTVTSLLWERYQAGAFPLAVVSMDNCSHNGEKLRSSVLTVAAKWRENSFVEDGFLAWLQDENKVAFPWSMIDKITPRPAKVVEDSLEALGVEDMAPIVTGKNTYIAPFVNAEMPQYLVVEDHFPNGRPPLEKAGVYMTTRDIVNQTERMKVTTCLNPLHTAMSVYGCLLGFTSIAEMKDADLKALVEKIGYLEGMPVVTNPGILSPEAFIHEVIDERLPNPFIPDTPQRIVTDTSQKVSIRFGETIKAYVSRDDLDVQSLTFIPLALAGWLRYLLAVDDQGQPMPCSSDPMLTQLQSELSGIGIGQTNNLTEKLTPILANETIFGVDLVRLGLADKVIGMVREELAGVGAVRATLHRYVNA